MIVTFITLPGTRWPHKKIIYDSDHYKTSLRMYEFVPKYSSSILKTIYRPFIITLSFFNPLSWSIICVNVKLNKGFHFFFQIAEFPQYLEMTSTRKNYTFLRSVARNSRTTPRYSNETCKTIFMPANAGCSPDSKYWSFSFSNLKFKGFWSLILN